MSKSSAIKPKRTVPCSPPWTNVKPWTRCSGIACRLSAEHSCGGSTRYSIKAIGMGLSRLTLSILRPGDGFGPKHQAWFDSTSRNRDGLPTSAPRTRFCYHDGHRSPRRAPRSDPRRCLSLVTTARVLRDEKTIRVTDMAFDEDVLIDQDRFLTARAGRAREFQRKMTGTELRYLLGAVYAEQERHNGRRGRACWRPATRLAIPIFRRRPPAMAASFLNSMKAVGHARSRTDSGVQIRSRSARPRSSKPARITAGGLFDNSAQCAGDHDPGRAAFPKITTCSPSPHWARSWDWRMCEATTTMCRSSRLR